MRGKRNRILIGLTAAGLLLFTSTRGHVHADQLAGWPSFPVSVAPLAIVDLYSQLDNQSGISGDVVSQQYEASLDASTTEVADDFELPASANPYVITSINVPGRYTGTGGNMPAVRIRYYTNSGSLPGAKFYEITVAPASDSAGTLVVTTSSPHFSPSTRYWISVQAVLNFLPGGRQWFWKARTVTSFNPSAWQTKSTLVPQCQNLWGARVATCGQGESSAVDQAFKLSGFAVTSVLYLPSISRLP